VGPCCLTDFMGGNVYEYVATTSPVNLGVDFMPVVQAPAEDRNRTSPFPYGRAVQHAPYASRVANFGHHSVLSNLFFRNKKLRMLTFARLCRSPASALGNHTLQFRPTGRVDVHNTRSGRTLRFYFLGAS
jgi:hypothetical protein